jgi:hypothetical protein
MIHKPTFPTKFINVSSAVIIVRRTAKSKKSFPHIKKGVKPCDYEVLMLKRNPKISFGNYYVFPGGMLEK